MQPVYSYIKRMDCVKLILFIMDLYKVVQNQDSGIYKDSSNNRVDLITAENRFYCPSGGICSSPGVKCGDPGTCCSRFNSIDDAISHFGLSKL